MTVLHEAHRRAVAVQTTVRYTECSSDPSSPLSGSFVGQSLALGTAVDPALGRGVSLHRHPRPLPGTALSFADVAKLQSLPLARHFRLRIVIASLPFAASGRGIARDVVASDSDRSSFLIEPRAAVASRARAVAASATRLVSSITSHLRRQYGRSAMHGLLTGVRRCSPRGRNTRCRTRSCVR